MTPISDLNSGYSPNGFEFTFYHFDIRRVTESFLVDLLFYSGPDNIVMIL